MFTRRLKLASFLGFAVLASLAACGSSEPTSATDGGRDAVTGSGGKGAGGGSGSGGATGSGGTQEPRTGQWLYGTWLGTWPDTTNGTTPSQFAGKQVKVVVYQTDVPLVGAWSGYDYKGSFTWDVGGADQWVLQFQRPSTTVPDDLVNFTFAWWLWATNTEQCTIQAHKDNSNHIRLTTSYVGAAGVIPSTLELNWELILGGVVETNGQGTGPKLKLVKQ